MCSCMWVPIHMYAHVCGSQKLTLMSSSVPHGLSGLAVQPAPWNHPVFYSQEESYNQPRTSLPDTLHGCRGPELVASHLHNNWSPLPRSQGGKTVL